MKPSESIAAFEEASESAGGSLPELTPRVGVECMLSFYAQVEAEGCSAESQDMLLFEWGTYNWGEGSFFELSISRQFMETGQESEPEISQLRLVFKYQTSGVFAKYGEGNHWCGSRAELLDFTRFVQANAAFLAVADREAPNVRLSHTYV